MRTFSQSEPTRLLSSPQGASLSQQHRLRYHKIQGPYHQYPQVPTVSLVPCPTLLNTVPTHFIRDETQRVATKPDFRQQKRKKEKKREKRKKRKKKETTRKKKRRRGKKRDDEKKKRETTRKKNDVREVCCIHCLGVPQFLHAALLGCC